MELDPVMHFVLITFLAVLWFIFVFLWEKFRETPGYIFFRGIVFKIIGKSPSSEVK